MKPNDKPPFSYPVRVGGISHNAVEVRLEASEAERRALAALWDVVEVQELTAQLQLGRWKRDGVRVKGDVRARLVLRRHARAGGKPDRGAGGGDLRSGRLETGPHSRQ